MRDSSGESVVGLGTAGRTVRLMAAAVVLSLTLVGTVWGQDTAFPFGPFRMYATRDGLDAPVSSTRVDGVNVEGERVAIDDSETGLRRAEIEGQIRRLIADPELLGLVADAYARRNPNKEPLSRMEVVVRRYELRAGARTGGYTETVLAAWDAEPVS